MFFDDKILRGRLRGKEKFDKVLELVGTGYVEGFAALCEGEWGCACWRRVVVFREFCSEECYFFYGLP